MRGNITEALQFVSNYFGGNINQFNVFLCVGANTVVHQPDICKLIGMNNALVCKCAVKLANKDLVFAQVSEKKSIANQLVLTAHGKDLYKEFQRVTKKR